MKKSWIIAIMLLIIFIICSVSVMASDNNALMEAGQYLKEFLSNTKQISETNDPDAIAAIYHDNIITKALIEHRRKTSGLLQTESVEYLSDYQIVNLLVRNMMIVEEAERLGLSATQAEIDNMLNETKQTFESAAVRDAMDVYFKSAGITMEEYFVLLEESVPAMIASNKLRTEIGKQYCEKNGLEYTNINPPQEMLDAIDAYIEELFEAHKGEIVYYIDN